MTHRKANKKSDKTKFDYYLQIVTNLSQIILVALAIFGYFYTVLPFYQNQLLVEENAQLIVEKNEILESLKEREEYYNREIEIKTRELKEINKELEKKADYVQIENAKLVKIQKENEKNNKEAEKILAQINSRIFITIFRNELFKNTFSRSNKLFKLAFSDDSLSTQFEGLNVEGIDTLLNEIFIQPTEIASDGLNKIINLYTGKPDQISLEYIDMSKKMLDVLALIRDKYIIKESSLLPIKIYLRDYIEKRDLLIKQIEVCKEISEKYELSHKSIEIRFQATRDFEEYSKNYIDVIDVYDAILIEMNNTNIE